MNALSANTHRATACNAKAGHSASARRPIVLGLLGTGNVGGALLRLLAENANGIALRAVANSRGLMLNPCGLDPLQVLDVLTEAEGSSDCRALAGFLLEQTDGISVLVDATPSRDTAKQHADWLAAGIHVVTANKIAAAHGWIPPATERDARYGDAATVGAGLPVLTTLRKLHAAGDRIHRVEGVLSGSLAWLFHALEEGRRFSDAINAARQAGYTEPDPRVDLSGTDVACKLAIITRTLGFNPVDLSAPESLLPTELLDASEEALPEQLPALDRYWRARFRTALQAGATLRYVASVTADGHTDIGVRLVERDNPLAQCRGTDNCVCIYSDAYPEQPLVIRGPGAGAVVTARGLLGDIQEVSAFFMIPADARQGGASQVP